MKSILMIDTLEQLKKFMNSDGIIEVVVRDRKKRYKNFYKLMLDNVKDANEKKVVQEAVNKLNSVLQLNEKSFELIGNVAKIQKISLLFNALNLCASCAGFAIVACKLDAVSNQMNKAISTYKQSNDVHANYEMNKVISDHADMLDCRRKHKYYTEEQMRELVDAEYNILNMMIDILIKELSDDSEELLFAIYSLVAMLATSLKYFDELYYFNNKEVLESDEVWHISHDNWVSLFDRLMSAEVVNRIQDIALFDMNLSTYETDVFYHSLYEQAQELKEDILDNQKLIKAIDNIDNLQEYKNCLEKIVRKDIEDAFGQTAGYSDNDELMKTCNDALKQIAIAV